MLTRNLTSIAFATVLLLFVGHASARGKQRPASPARHRATGTTLPEQLQHADPNNLPVHLRNNPILRAQMEAMAQWASQQKHKSTFDSAGKLQQEASAHTAAGRHGEAVQCRRQAVNVLESALGKNDDRVLGARVELARAEYGMGKHEQALKTLDEALNLLEGKPAPTNKACLHKRS